MKGEQTMRETIKTSRTAGYLEKIFRAVNTDWFGGELEAPIITIQSTPRAYGHVTVSKIWKRKGEQRHELNIGAETLQRPIEEVVRPSYTKPYTCITSHTGYRIAAGAEVTTTSGSRRRRNGGGW